VFSCGVQLSIDYHGAPVVEVVARCAVLCPPLILRRWRALTQGDPQPRSHHRNLLLSRSRTTVPRKRAAVARKYLVCQDWTCTPRCALLHEHRKKTNTLTHTSTSIGRPERILTAAITPQYHVAELLRYFGISCTTRSQRSARHEHLGRRYQPRSCSSAVNRSPPLGGPKRS
jgi:hypothetical protein